MVLEPLRYLGPLEFLLMVFAVVVTGFLFIRRIRRCRQGIDTYDLRDFLMLVAGPVIALLLFFAKASLAAAYYGTVDLDSDAPLRLGMQAASACVSVGVCCFALGLVGMLWPVFHK